MKIETIYAVIYRNPNTGYEYVEEVYEERPHAEALARYERKHGISGEYIVRQFEVVD